VGDLEGADAMLNSRWRWLAVAMPYFPRGIDWTGCAMAHPPLVSALCCIF